MWFGIVLKLSIRRLDSNNEIHKLFLWFPLMNTYPWLIQTQIAAKKEVQVILALLECWVGGNYFISHSRLKTCCIFIHIFVKNLKVNGTLVTNSNHKEVVNLIKAGSYVALTLLSKPRSSRSSGSGKSKIPIQKSNKILQMYGTNSENKISTNFASVR